MNGSLTRSTVLLPIPLKELFCTYLVLLTPENTELQALFLSRRISIHLGKLGA
jgi:hypothetical protein